MYFDSNYLLCVMLPAIILGALAQWYLKSTYSTWKQRGNSAGYTGVDTAQLIMKTYGLTVRLQHVQQELGDHYDPTQQSVGMSPDIATLPSIASMAVAAHEFGHVQQYAENSPLIRARMAILPVAQLGSQAWSLLVIGGLILNFLPLSIIGLLLFSAVVAFSILTLPVEFDASRRGLKMLNEMGLMRTQQDRSGAQAVLRAAALTYVVSTFIAILTLAYYAMLVLGNNRRR